MIRHNLVYKLMALVVALALWSFGNTERNPQSRKVFTIPIEVAHVEDGYVAEINVRDANISVEGPKSAVDALRREEITATADMAGFTKSKPGTGEVSVQPRLKESEGSLDVEVNPKTVKVRIEALGDERLPVEVRFPAVPPLGYAYSNPVLTPASVSITGRMSDVLNVKKVILTLPSRISSGMIDSSFPVTAVDNRGVAVAGVNLDTDKVRLKLDLVEVPASKTVIVSPDVSGMPEFPAKVSRVTVTPSLVTLQGRPAALAEVTTIDTENIAIDNAIETVRRDVNLRLPRGVSIVGRGKVHVTVHIIGASPQTP